MSTTSAKVLPQPLHRVQLWRTLAYDNGIYLAVAGLLVIIAVSLVSMGVQSGSIEVKPTGDVQAFYKVMTWVSLLAAIVALFGLWRVTRAVNR